MKTVRLRFFIHLQWFLAGTLVYSSSPSSSTPLQSIVSTVGDQVVLPCSWKSHQGEVSPSTCYLQWTKPVRPVFELQGTKSWQAPEFRGRMEVAQERLGSGDCSLIIRDVQIGDTGIYDSFLVVNGVRNIKTRLFIQSTKLSVFDHKSSVSRREGEDLVLELFTHHSYRVVFLGRNSSEWSDLWIRGDADSERVEKHPVENKLTIKRLKSSDEGLYKVLDEHGLSVSTVQLYVDEGSAAFKVYQSLEYDVATDDAVRSSCPAVLILSALVTSFKILHIL